MRKNKVIVVQNINITVSEENLDDYICITDIAKAKVGESRGADVVKTGCETEQLWNFWNICTKCFGMD